MRGSKTSLLIHRLGSFNDYFYDGSLSLPNYTIMPHLKIIFHISGGYALAQLIEALCDKPESRGFRSR
jgi:hypothetical protein